MLIGVDSMSAVMDAAIKLTEEHPPQLEMSGDTFLVDVTLGIAVYPSHADDAATLFRRAELALKAARENELSFDIYRPDATSQQAALWKFESELKSAVQQNELEVYFQPKVEIKERRVCGVEALVRWRMQSGRFVPASDFIPLAERSGMHRRDYLARVRPHRGAREGMGGVAETVLGRGQRLAASAVRSRVLAETEEAEVGAR